MAEVALRPTFTALEIATDDFLAIIQLRRDIQPLLSPHSAKRVGLFPHRQNAPFPAQAAVLRTTRRQRIQPVVGNLSPAASAQTKDFQSPARTFPLKNHGRLFQQNRPTAACRQRLL
jgi:hypothetical protein